jgi:peptidoglycan/xylan/chitin deacetylase (PgdA/CDA1 family)
MIASRRTVLAALAAGALTGCGRPSSLASGGRAASAAPAAAGSRAPGVVPPAVPSAAPALTRAQWWPGTATSGRIPGLRGTWGGPRPAHVAARDRADLRRLRGPGGSGYDRALIGFLRRREVPATLFLNSRWIDANPAAFGRLAAEPLFEIANHDTRHLPLSVTGRSAYGIGGTRNAGAVYDEVATKQAKLRRLLGVPPRFFRAGTAYCDDVAARIVTAMGDRLVSFSVNGDGEPPSPPGKSAAPSPARQAVPS